MLVFLLSFILWFMGKEARPSDRCQQYAHTVRVNHFKYFGINYPYHYGMGQLRQESSCRSNITSFDAGRGIAQFMPKTEKYCEQHIGEFNPMNPYQAIRAQAWYMSQINKQNWNGALWLTYQAYNGGWSLLKKESQRAGITNHVMMRRSCRRNIIHLKNGQLLDLCTINYDYSRKVYSYGNEYRRFNFAWRYW